MNDSAAGIVLYNPDLERLKESIISIQSQVKMVYCYDNDSKNKQEIKELLLKYDNVIYLSNNQNLGIATAINKIVAHSKNDAIKWLLTLDQDSICSENMVVEFSKYKQLEEVAIICPLMVDKRRPEIEIPSETCLTVDFCITSGSFMNLKLFDKIGRMDDYLFVGLVDDDYCYRTKLFGYKIIQINSVVLDHELGSLTTKKISKQILKLGELFSSNKIKALSYRRTVSPMRVYYATRNIIYLSKKYNDYPAKKFSKKMAIYNSLSNILRGHNKIEILRASIKGFSTARKKNISSFKFD